MDAIENVQFDLVDAASSLETALELLTSLQEDGEEGDLKPLLKRLRRAKREVDAVREELERLPAAADSDST